MTFTALTWQLGAKRQFGICVATRKGEELWTGGKTCLKNIDLRTIPK